MRKSWLMYAGICGVAALSMTAAGQYGNWTDDFDSAPLGPMLSPDPVYGWSGWDGNPAYAGIVNTDFAYSGTQSLRIDGALGTDAIYFLDTPVTSGTVTVSSMTYVATGEPTAGMYWLIQNLYAHGGPYDWAVQNHFDEVALTVYDDYANWYPTARLPGPGHNMPIVFDRWVEMRVEVDLTMDYCEIYYDNVMISSGKWLASPAPTGGLEIQNHDLFTTGGTYYVDDTFMAGGPPPVFDIASTGGGCPGPMEFTASNATPDKMVAFIFGRGLGSSTIPGAMTCGGTQLGMVGPKLIKLIRADGTGTAVLKGPAKPTQCNKYIQALDVATCTTSSVLKIQ